MLQKKYISVEDKNYFPQMLRNEVSNFFQREILCVSFKKS